MTTQEKIDWLIATNSECPRTDIRKILTERIAESGVTRMQVAKALNTHKGDFYSRLGGKIAIPTKMIEQLLWLTDPNEGIPND